ncbi:NmrA family transcriptional regulator [Modestobacter sp. NPDC049651]|uniref:NmrA family transcriptional regulator n=1 Tax=unclassified Modestobacter TaxID=2643866 RepID=UPI0033CDA21A
MSTGTQLVTGGTGTTGRRVVARLQARGVPVRGAARSTGFDWERPATWDAALAGVTGVYLAYAPDLAVPGADAVVGQFTARAAAAGVQRVVLLSGRGEPGAEAAERAVLGTAGVRATVLRCSWFAQNFTEGQFAGAVRSGELALPVGDVAEPFLDADDIADAAVAVLLGDGPDGVVHELTGPRALTFGAVTDEIAAALGRPVVFRSVTAAEFRAGLAADGVPAEVADLLVQLFTEVLDGRNARTTDGVARLLGRPAREVTDHLRAGAAAGAWS